MLSYSSSSSSNQPHQRRPSPHPIVIPTHLNPFLSSPTFFPCSSKSNYLHAILITVILSLTVIPSLYSSCTPFISILYDPRHLYSCSDASSSSSIPSSSSFYTYHLCSPHLPRPIPVSFVLLVIFILTVPLSSSSSSSASPSSYHITYLVPCLLTSSSFLLIILIHTLTEMALCESVWRKRTTVLFWTTLTQSIKRNILLNILLVLFSAYLWPSHVSGGCCTRLKRGRLLQTSR